MSVWLFSVNVLGMNCVSTHKTSFQKYILPGRAKAGPRLTESTCGVRFCHIWLTVKRRQNTAGQRRRTHTRESDWILTRRYMKEVAADRRRNDTQCVRGGFYKCWQQVNQRISFHGVWHWQEGFLHTSFWSGPLDVPKVNVTKKTESNVLVKRLLKKFLVDGL